MLNSAAEVRLRHMLGNHHECVTRSLRRYGVRDGDVDDLAQRVFLTAARRMAAIREGSERAYLLAIAAREAGHIRRSYRRRAEITTDVMPEDATGSSRPDELTSKKQSLAQARSALDAMTDELRTVFVLFELEERSASEIAALLAIPLGTAKSRLRRARDEFASRTAAMRRP